VTDALGTLEEEGVAELLAGVTGNHWRFPRSRLSSNQFLMSPKGPGAGAELLAWRLAKSCSSDSNQPPMEAEGVGVGVGVTEALEEGVAMLLLLEGTVGRAMAEPRRERREMPASFMLFVGLTAVSVLIE
jgi:hypothetical protein